MAIKSAFSMKNQSTYIKQTLPESLKKFYVQRLTTGNLNIALFKFYFDF